MIKINLAPYEESQDRLWFLPDVSMLAASYLITQLTCGYILRDAEENIADLHQKTEAQKTVMTQLTPKVKEVTSIQSQIKTLTSRKDSMNKITDSKLNRYLPIILFEHLQNLKPEGLWFTSATMTDKLPVNNDPAPATPPPGAAPVPGAPADPNAPKTPPPGGATPVASANVNRPGFNAPVYIMIEGNAFNPSLIAEFMTSLKATRNQDVDPSDLRTQVFFPKVGLVDLSVSEARILPNQDTRLVRFNFYVSHEERKSSDIPRGTSMQPISAGSGKVPSPDAATPEKKSLIPPAKDFTTKPAKSPAQANPDGTVEPNVSANPRSLAPAEEVPL